MVIVIGLNCLLAVLVLGLARLFWQWRCAMVRLNQHLQNHPPNTQLTSQKMGYSLTRHRTQIALSRLRVAQWQQWQRQWQLRSRQINQTFQAIQILRSLLSYRSGQSRSRRRVNRRIK